MPGHLSEPLQDEQAFRTLYDEYAERVYQYANAFTRSPELAEDITQELFLILWRKRDDLHQVENMDGYIFRIARNLAIKLLKKAALDIQLSVELYRHAIKENNAIDEALGSKAVKDLLEKAVLELPPQPRKIYLLSRKEFMNFDEIAEVTGLSRNTVKNHLQKALNEIRDYLVKHGYQISIAALIVREFYLF
ncbi:hypothetical protein COR50_14305 [Chitinophaga caeni]|uniref:RNA polymerase sigma-70 factor n=1 Tax=Chitinophaga caeni TaxID=2029983 RepID=A0A291QW29_9BACT|nr:RNA polymerase sigma-70 factor [Chitinophaga caeni]ATL48239.1 hypothetical protein COR50_14305 [Chitinophaga caeni]